jgi:hypothetical protein
MPGSTSIYAVAKFTSNGICYLGPLGFAYKRLVELNSNGAFVPTEAFRYVTEDEASAVSKLHPGSQVGKSMAMAGPR